MRGYNPVENMKAKRTPSALQVYHDSHWKPISDKVDNVIKRVKILRVIKKAFDVHFTVLGVLGIYATPPNDIDCYLYLWRRSKPHKYQHLGWRNRGRILRALFTEVWRA